MPNLATKIIEEYNFAKSQGFELITIVIDTEYETYNISEYCTDGEFQGYISDSFDCLYGNIDDIAKDLAGIVDGEVCEIRIE